jgi:hypothetical protein
MSLLRRKIPLYAYIGALFLCLLLIAAGVIILVQYRQTKEIVRAARSSFPTTAPCLPQT